MRRRTNHGGATIEFALLSPFLIGLIVGTLIYGSQLVKELELQQVARDTASMCARGTNFNASANQQIVSRLGQALNWPSTGGLTSSSPAVVYVSTIEYLDSTCNGYAGPCSNKGNWVFVRSVSFGNTNLRNSNFGAPVVCSSCYDPKQDDGSLNSADTYNNSAARVKNFTYLGTPDSTATGFQPGQYAFLIEVAGVTGSWGGSNVSYTFSLF